MSEQTDILNVAEEFSAYPAGRDEGDGPNNGARFRNDLLIPRLKAAIAQGKQLVVSLDGVRSFGSSFLEESFGGLMRAGMSRATVRKHLLVTSSSAGSSRYLDAVERYIERARG